MTKSERRKARKQARDNGERLTGDLALDRDNGPVDFGPERLSNGRYNINRARALDRHAKFVYDYDRD